MAYGLSVVWCKLFGLKVPALNVIRRPVHLGISLMIRPSETRQDYIERHHEEDAAERCIYDICRKSLYNWKTTIPNPLTDGFVSSRLEHALIMHLTS